MPDRCRVCGEPAAYAVGNHHYCIVVADGYHAVSGGIGPVPEGESDLASDVALLRAGP